MRSREKKAEEIWERSDAPFQKREESPIIYFSKLFYVLILLKIIITMTKSLILSVTFIFLFKANAFAEVDINNPRNIFYRGYYKNCGEPQLTVKFHLCNQRYSLKNLKEHFRDISLKNSDREKYLDIFSRNYYYLLTILSEYEDKQISNSFLTERIYEIADNTEKEITNFAGRTFKKSEVLKYLKYEQ